MTTIKSICYYLENMESIKGFDELTNKLDNYFEFFEYFINNNGKKIINIYKHQKRTKIKPEQNNNSYLQVEINNKLYFVHELVAKTFIPNENNYLIIRHKDDDILNNYVENLEWVNLDLDLSHIEYICNINFLKIPEFLHDSELYKTCLESGDDFNILKKYYKNDLIIESIDDFIHLLYTLRFWCINMISYEIYDCIIENKNLIMKYLYVLKEIFYDFLLFEEFEILIGYKSTQKNIISICTEKGFLNLMKYCYKNNYPWNSSTCSNAAKHGHLSCLKYAHENGCPWDKYTCFYGASNGHLVCLKYAHENGCPWDLTICYKAAENGHLACLKYAYENGCPWDKYTCFDAVSNGHLACLKYAHKNGCPWDKFTCANAARHGHLSCLKYLYENGCPWDSFTCTSAIAYGHLSILKYAHENGCEWKKEKYIRLGLKNNYLECVKYIEEN